MIGKLLKTLVWLIKLPVRLVMLPFKIVSAAISVLIYVGVFTILGVIVYLFLL